ncbi:guanine-nucleotide dissociation stimulator CDC25, partial [Aureobasidium melanogenum]
MRIQGFVSQDDRRVTRVVVSGAGACCKQKTKVIRNILCSFHELALVAVVNRFSITLNGSAHVLDQSVPGKRAGAVDKGRHTATFVRDLRADLRRMNPDFAGRNSRTRHFGFTRRFVVGLRFSTFIATCKHLRWRTGLVVLKHMISIMGTWFGLLCRVLQRQFHGTDTSQSVEVEQAAIWGGLWNPECSLLLAILGSVCMAIGRLGGHILEVVACVRLSMRIRYAGSLGRDIAWLSNELAVVAGKPSSHTADNAIPPAALELGDNLDDVALAEAQAGAVVGIVVVECTHIHGAHWGGSEAIHVDIRQVNTPWGVSRSVKLGTSGQSFEACKQKGMSRSARVLRGCLAESTEGAKSDCSKNGRYVGGVRVHKTYLRTSMTRNPQTAGPPICLLKSMDSGSNICFSCSHYE